MKHTKGPWTSKAETKVRYSSVTGEKLDDTTVYVYGPNELFVGLATTARAEHLANASLMSAAPEMLEALEEALDCFGEDDPTWHKVSIAIQKAKGE